MKKSFPALLLTTALIAGCASEESKVIEKVRADIAVSAIDPSAVRFKDLRVVGEDIGQGLRNGYVCGEASFPKRSGGHYEFQRFNVPVVWSAGGNPLGNQVEMEQRDANKAEWIDRCAALAQKKA